MSSFLPIISPVVIDTDDCTGSPHTFFNPSLDKDDESFSDFCGINTCRNVTPYYSYTDCPGNMIINTLATLEPRDIYCPCCDSTLDIKTSYT